MGKVAILGGTFDPIHWGHLLLAETALSQIALEQVIWVPDRCPPHKQATGFEHRFEMVQRAIADHPAFTMSPLSANRDTTYAIQTLTDLQNRYQHSHWYWIVGLDAFQTLPRWHRRQDLVRACDWLVVPRVSLNPRTSESDSITPALTEFNCQRVAQQLADETSLSLRWQLLQMPTVGVSSSLIRQYCRDRRSIRYLVPEAVRSYIATHDLYSQRSA